MQDMTVLMVDNWREAVAVSGGGRGKSLGSEGLAVSDSYFPNYPPSVINLVAPPSTRKPLVFLFFDAFSRSPTLFGILSLLIGRPLRTRARDITPALLCSLLHHSTMTDKLTSIRKYSDLWADSMDVPSSVGYKPTGATSNPVIILANLQQSHNIRFLTEAVDYVKKNHASDPKERQVYSSLTLFLLILLSLPSLPAPLSSPHLSTLLFPPQSYTIILHHLSPLSKTV